MAEFQVVPSLVKLEFWTIFPKSQASPLISQTPDGCCLHCGPPKPSVIPQNHDFCWCLRGLPYYNVGPQLQVALQTQKTIDTRYIYSVHIYIYVNPIASRIINQFTYLAYHQATIINHHEQSPVQQLCWVQQLLTVETTVSLVKCTSL